MRSRCHRRTGNNCGLLLLPRVHLLRLLVGDAAAAGGAYWEGNLAEMSADDGLVPVHPEVNDDTVQVMATIPLAVVEAAG